MKREKMDLNNSLVLKNYKEPLTKVKKGFGYIGAVRMTLDGTKMECHICGGLYESVGMHAAQAHKTSAKDYKVMFGLSATTALISESKRENDKLKFMRWWWGLSQAERTRITEKGKKGWADYRKKNKYKQKRVHSAEEQNLRGSCPDQTAEQIRLCAIALKHTPSQRDFLNWSGSWRFIYLARKNFGSWERAVKYAKLKAKDTPSRKRSIRKYDNDDLLDLLKLFYQENGKIPTESDCKRGFIPHSNVYKRHFGSLPKARRLAGITEELGARNTVQQHMTFKKHRDGIVGLINPRKLAAM